MAPLLPFTQSQPLRTLKSCAGSTSLQSNVWLLRRWRLAQVFFDALILEGETMDIFACGLGRMGNGIFDAIITFITFIGCVLALLAVFVVASVKGLRRL